MFLGVKTPGYSQDVPPGQKNAASGFSAEQGRFMVSMHTEKRKEGFHEPQRAAGIHPPQCCYGGWVLPTEEPEKITADGTSAAPWRRRVN
jgi:hypothetical protein